MILIFFYFGLPAIVHALQTFMAIAYITLIAIVLIVLRMSLVIRQIESHRTAAYASPHIWKLGIREVGLAGICGIVLIGMAISIAALGARWFESASLIQSFEVQSSNRIMLLAPLILVAYDEELFYRGLGFQLMQKYQVPGWIAILATALFFAISHIPYGIITITNALVGGILLSYCHYRVQRIHVVALAHALSNVGAALIWWFGPDLLMA